MTDHMNELTRRTLIATSAAAGFGAAVLGDASAIAGSGPAIRPYRVNFSDAEVADMRRRISATKWPDPEYVADASQGVQQATMQKLARYWAVDYDFHRFAKSFAALPHFITEIDGLDIHFIHVKSKHPNAMPIIITHGWPGSVVEQLKVIGPLTDPTAHGGKAEDAFDVVIPSLPGYGFSERPKAIGWYPPRIAKAWGTLMQRLGYNRYVAQGGDWGNAVTELMALQELRGLIGVSTNMPATLPPEISKALATNTPPPSGLSPDEKYAWDQLKIFYTKGLAYAQEMGLRPQTLYGIADSPVGLAAWILDHDWQSYDLIVRVFDGKHEGLTRDDILDNITYYWLTNTAISSARLYWETTNAAKPGDGGFFDVRGVKLPMVVTVFKHEIYAAPKTWAEKAYPNMILYSRHDIGTHFAAWEQPDLLVKDLREGFRSLRRAA